MSFQESRAKGPFRFLKVLTEDEGASTLIRLFESRHVVDLQLIFWASCILMIAGSIFVFGWHAWVDHTGVIKSPALISAIVGVGCGVLAWCYQTGSARLGIVDLFACEISTICRVVAITDTAPNLVRMHGNPPAQTMKFTSQEQYSPIFDSNSKELEVMEARVVERVTEFYTYLKAMRDYLRILSDIDHPQDDKERWNATVRSIVYMLFLMLKSARKAVERLVEYEPERAQNTITILLSELVAYRLLLSYYESEASNGKSSDARLERLRLRKKDYPRIVHAICDRISALESEPLKDREGWERAAALVDELKHRYRDVFDDRETANAEGPAPASIRSVA